MLEIISILCSIALLIVTPMQTAQLRAGKINPKFKGTPEAYVASWRKQVNLVMWLGVVFAPLNLAYMLLPSEPGEWVVNIVSAALWAGVAAVGFWSRQQIASMPTPAAAPPPGASA